METTYSVLGLQVAAMLEGIEQDRDAQVEEILAAAEERRRDLLEEAGRRCRMRLKETIREERARLERRTQRESAGLATTAREHRLQKQKERLRRGRPLAADALRQRWLEPDHRRTWEDATIAASAVLEPGSWQVEYPAGLEHAELQRLTDDLGRRAGQEPKLCPSAELDAGFRLRSQDVCLDLSVDALLSDRVNIDGLLLATIMELEDGAQRGQ